MAGTECRGREEDGIHTDSIEDPKPDKGQQAPLQQCSPSRVRTYVINLTIVSYIVTISDELLNY